MSENVEDAGRPFRVGATGSRILLLAALALSLGVSGVALAVSSGWAFKAVVIAVIGVMFLAGGTALFALYARGPLVAATNEGLFVPGPIQDMRWTAVNALELRHVVSWWFVDAYQLVVTPKDPASLPRRGWLGGVMSQGKAWIYLPWPTPPADEIVARLEALSGLRVERRDDRILR